MIKLKPDWRRKKLPLQLVRTRLEGQRLYLTPPAIDDYAEWSLLRAKNQKFLEPYEPTWPKDCLTRNFFTRRLKRQAEEVAAGRGQYFFIRDKMTHDILGGLNLNNIQMGAAKQAALGYWLDEDTQGQGYMGEAVRTLTAHAFDNLGLRRLNAACLPDNTRSVTLLLNCGFEEEGFAKAYLQINGKWQDHRLFGLVNKSL